MRPIAAALKAALDSWLDTERERLALWLPVFMGAGVLAYYTLRFEPAPWVGAAAALPAIGLAAGLPGLRWLFAPARRRRSRLYLGPIRHCPRAADRGRPANPRHHRHRHDPRGRAFAGGTPHHHPAGVDRWRGRTVCAARCESGCKRRTMADLDSGDSVRIRALIRPPSPPSYPGAWDLQRDDFYSGLGASGYALAKAERTAQAVPSGTDAVGAMAARGHRPPGRRGDPGCGRRGLGHAC